MHSRILVLDDTKFDFDDLDVDYVVDSDSEPSLDLEWFLNYTGFSKGTMPLSFRVDSVKDFWDKMTDDVQEMISKEGGITGNNRHAIQSRINMKHDFLIAYEYVVYTLPQFLETFVKDGAEFEIKKFLDYHF